MTSLILYNIVFKKHPVSFFGVCGFCLLVGFVEIIIFVDNIKHVCAEQEIFFTTVSPLPG